MFIEIMDTQVVDKTFPLYPSITTKEYSNPIINMSLFGPHAYKIKREIPRMIVK